MHPSIIEAFLIPGVFGDEPQIHVLCERLRSVFSFDLLPLPDVGTRSIFLTDMTACGCLLADEVRRRRPFGDIALIGYSFGASMALEVAAHLTAAGRHVAYIAVLDGPFEPPRIARPSETSGSLSASCRAVKSTVVNATAPFEGLRRLVVKAATPETTIGAHAEPLRRAMLWHLRNKALTGWVPQTSKVPGLHVCSGEYGPENRARWAALCPNLYTVDIPAAHERLLQGEALEAVLKALVDSITTLVQQPRGEVQHSSIAIGAAVEELRTSLRSICSSGLVSDRAESVCLHR